MVEGITSFNKAFDYLHTTAISVDVHQCRNLSTNSQWVAINVSVKLSMHEVTWTRTCNLGLNYIAIRLHNSFRWMWSRWMDDYILPVIWLSSDYCFHNWLRSYHTHLSRRKGTDRKLKKSVDATECHQHNSIAGLLILFCLSYHSFGHLHHNVVWQSGNDRNTVSNLIQVPHFCCHTYTV